ncbi:hypothetical protein GCM10022243_41770 [Saccharothrix violaceirubra]|uniref:8-oxo-dGTP diphosphatase n=1 Tax=Saccharothrix violaceirubra TaxID=413306 RepID=A0A7W7WYE0_9PSEU|nr:NUDIX domain-containing protein [Saccharothrix violaceirubra]MBB4968434.1 8-oxo-dGTP diphosphatase [Saccharothrix violaceirubra]
MSVVRATALVDVPVATVAGAVVDVGTLGVRVDGGGLLYEGAEFSLVGRSGRVVVTRAGLGGVGVRVVADRSPEFWLGTDVRVTGAGVLVVHEVGWRQPRTVWERVVDVAFWRRIALRLLEDRAARVAKRIEELVEARVVVGAAVVRGDRLLVQQRGFPAEVAGKWELPGGRVEVGEDDRAAVVRECREELGVEVKARQQVGLDVPLKADLLLRVYAADLINGEPVAEEHQGVRWVRVDELADLDWLPADRVLVPALRELLSAQAGHP